MFRNSSSSSSTSSASSLRLLTSFLALALYLGVCANANPVADGEPSLARRGQHIDVPLRRAGSPEIAKRSTDHFHEFVQADIVRLKNKYAANLNAYEDKHKGKKNSVFSSSHKLLNSTTFTMDNCTDASSSGSLRSRKSTRSASVGTESIYPVSGYTYWAGDITIGTPAQTIVADFDTGSADLVLNKDQYYASKSSTAATKGVTWTAGYADGSEESGTLYTDIVTVGGKSVSSQSFGVPTTSNFASSDPAILGMAFQAISSFDRRPVVQHLYTQGVIPEEMFGLALARQSSNAEIRLGGYNSDKIKSGSSLSWNSVDASTGFWNVDGATITFKNSSGTKGSISSRALLIDSGTTLIYGSTSDVAALYKAIGVTTKTYSGAVYGFIPSDSIPTVAFKIGGVTYDLKKHATYSGSDGSYYIGTIIGYDGFGLASDQWLVGDPFLESVYAVFDIANTRLGFAAANF